MKDTATLIKATVQDCVADLLYYGRKEDEELKVGDIEDAIQVWRCNSGQGRGD